GRLELAFYGDRWRTPSSAGKRVSGTDFPDVRPTSGGRGLPILLDQLIHALGHLRAVREPVVRALEVDLELALAAGRDRIEEAEALDVPAVAAVAAVRHDDVIEGALRRSAARQTYRDHKLRILGPRRPA